MKFDARKSIIGQFRDGAAAAELAIKLHALTIQPELMNELAEEESALATLLAAVDLTEAPEDAICTLILDVMAYCECKGINWDSDIMHEVKRLSPSSATRNS